LGFIEASTLKAIFAKVLHAMNFKITSTVLGHK